MRIAVMGAGGTGGYYGGLLARAGEDVTFIARGPHLEAMRNRGLTIKSQLAGDFTLPVKATNNPAEIGPVDLVLFCVKSYDTDTVAQLVQPLLCPDTVVFSIQNGIDNWERIGRIVGPDKVLCAAVYMSSNIEGPGVISQTAASGRIIFGELMGIDSPRTNRLLNTFQQAGINAELHPNIQVQLWEKFIAICGFSGVPSLTRLTMGPILACPETRALLQCTMEEVERVAREQGVELPGDWVNQQMAHFARLGPGARGSMYFDLAAGRRLELESLNGTVVRMGRELGVDTPYNFAIYAALKPYVNGAPNEQ